MWRFSERYSHSNVLRLVEDIIYSWNDLVVVSCEIIGTTGARLVIAQSWTAQELFPALVRSASD